MKSPKMRSAFAPNLMWRGGAELQSSPLMIVPLAGCGSNQPAAAARAPMRPDKWRLNSQMAPAANQGMSTGTKLKILAGAAAAYYLYKKYTGRKAKKARPMDRTKRAVLRLEIDGPASTTAILKPNRRTS